MGYMMFVAHTSNTRTGTVPIAVSAFSRCPHTCIFGHSEGHNGPDRARNTNLSALASENMWSQPILIELLAVLLLLQTQMTFPPVPLAISHDDNMLRRENGGVKIVSTKQCKDTMREDC